MASLLVKSKQITLKSNTANLVSCEEVEPIEKQFVSSE